MDDLISRQAAINAVEHITSSMSICLNKDECRCYKDGYVDGAGYFSCAGEIAERRSKE